MSFAASGNRKGVTGRPDDSAAPAVRFDPQVVIRVLPWAAAFVAGAGIAREIFLARFGTGTILTTLRQFDFDGEGTVQAWFSSLVLLMCACLLGVAAGLSRREGDIDWRRWAILGGIFVFLSLDETAGFHEGLIIPVRTALKLTGALYFSWVVPAMVFVAWVGLYFIPFVLRLPRKHAASFVLAGVVYVGGALGIEMVSSYEAWNHGMKSTPYIVSTCIEETLEIAGATLFCCFLLMYLRDRWGVWAVAVSGKPTA
jgi:hypothetical protein